VFVSKTRSTSYYLKEYKDTEMFIHNSSQGRIYLVSLMDTEDERILEHGTRIQKLLHSVIVIQKNYGAQRKKIRQLE